MAQEERAPSEDMKKGLLHWFNTVGSGGFGGQQVDYMEDLWKEHVPALLLYLKNECKNLTGARGESADQVYMEAMEYMRASTESKHMAASLNSSAAANGNELEISKFLLLFWHELCISDSKIMEDSIAFLEQVNLQHTMGNAIEWMNKATDNQDFNRWFDVLFENPLEDDELNAMEEAKTPVDAGDAKTPTEAFDKSIERNGEDTFTFTTPSNIPMRHSFYERDVSSMRNSLMMTPRLSARRQLPVPSSEPRPFVAPHPVTRGSPIAEQLHSPAMREKRREREMRSLQHKLSLAQEDRDAKEIELKKISQTMNELYESNRLLKEKANDQKREWVKESRMREETETELDELKKEKGSLNERIDELSSEVKKWKHDYELSIDETSRLTETIEELSEKLVAKSREIVDFKDEVKARTMALEEARESILKEKKNGEELKQQLVATSENLEEMREDWRKRLKEKENEMIEIECSNHAKIGEMNEYVMKTEAELMKVGEALEIERRRGEELRRSCDEEIRIMREGMEEERSKMMEEMREKKMKLERLEEERGKLMKEKEEANEKAYAAILENDIFTAMIENMRREEEERIKEQDWNETCLRSEITTANKEKEHAEEKMRNEKKEREEEQRMNEDTEKRLMATEEKLNSLQFVHKNEMKKLKGLENELKKNDEVNKQNVEMKEKVERLEKELENLRESAKDNMDTVVAKKKELERELSKKEKTIDKLNEDILGLNERMKELAVLMNFDEEPTQMGAKSNLSMMKEKGKENVQVAYHERQRAMGRIAEDKEKDGMMTLVNTRRQLPPMDSNRRVMDIADRNAKTMPHLRSHHAVEQMSPNFSQNGLAEGIVRPESHKKLSAIRSRFSMGKK